MMTHRIFCQRTADERFAHVAGLCEAAGNARIRVTAGYSVKTNPHELMLAAARRHGFRAEVISDSEATWAEHLGFVPGSIIYNGPHSPAMRSERIGLVFADSLEAFARARRLGLAELIGIRLRPAVLRTSRFGVPVEEDDDFAAQLRECPLLLGISMHARRGDYGRATWRDLCDDLIGRGMRFERETNCEIVAFDTGGGWEPQQFDQEFASDAQWLVARLSATLPAVRTLIVEPGQAIATPVEAIVTTVIEVRRRPGRLEVVIDIGHGDWPSQHEYEHGFAVALNGGEWRPIECGGDRLSGNTCLEYDFIDGLRFPRDVAVGDGILVRNTGSYDRSMGFPFGRGVLPESLREEVHSCAYSPT
jgi:diaminopimelate decarboxylase